MLLIRAAVAGRPANRCLLLFRLAGSPPSVCFLIAPIVCWVRELRMSTAEAAGAMVMRPFDGGLNGSTQHSILKGKDGVFGDASRLFSRLYGIRENRALGSLAAGRVAESDLASVWEAIIVKLFSPGPTRGNSSPATAPLKAGIDTRRARGNIQSYSARSIGAIDSQVARPLALVGEQGNQPQWRL